MSSFSGLTITVATIVSVYTNTNQQWGGYTLDAYGNLGDSFCPDGQIWSASYGIAGCCVPSNGRCDLTLGCIGQSTIFGVNYTTTCRSGLQCDTDLVYSQYPTDGSGPWAAIYCGGINAQTSYYRKAYSTITTTYAVSNPTTAANSGSTVASSASPSSSSSMITVLSTSSSTTSASSSSSSSSSSSTSSRSTSSSARSSSAQNQSASGSQVVPDSASSSASVPVDNGPNNSSQAWIAGPVVGAVAGVALIAGVAYYLLTKRPWSNGGFAEKSGANGNGAAPLMSPTMSPNANDYAGRTTLPL